MLSKNMRRCLSFVMALVMVCSLLPFQILAAETGDDLDYKIETQTTAAPESTAASEPATEPVAEPTSETSDALAQIQTGIDDILTRYLGTTEMSAEDIQTKVAAMDWETYQTARWEISELDSSAHTAMESGQLMEADLNTLDSGMVTTFSAFSDALEERAATDNTVATYATGSVSKLDLLSTGDGTIGIEGTTATLGLSATGGMLNETSKNTTVTITNNSGNEAQITFNYASSGTGTYTVTLDSRVVNTGSAYAITLANGDSFTVTMSATGAAWWSTSTANATLSNITVTPIFNSATVTVQYNSAMGRVNVGTASGTEVAPGATVETTKDFPTTLVATASGSQFVAWVDPTANNKVLSTNASFSVVPTANAMTVQPIFADSTPWFLVNDSQYAVQGLNEAISFINSSGTIILANNATLPAGNYTIPANVNLLIPFSATDTGTFGEIPEDATLVSTSAPKTFRTLTVPSNATITCNGKINVNGQRKVTGQGASGTGVPKGGHGKIILQGEGTQLTIGSTGALYCYGFITGSGTVELNGGDLHELMQVYDWAGGTNISGWYLGVGSWDKDKTLFFTSHYYVQNVEAPLKVNAGSDMFIEAVLTASSSQVRSSAKIVSSSDSDEGLFLLGNGTHLIRTYDSTTDRVKYALGGSGSATFGSMKVSAMSYDLDSSAYTLPLNNAITVLVGSGVTMNMGNRSALMPGSQVIVDDGGTLNLTNHLYIFDKDDKTGLFFANQLSPLYTAGRSTTNKMSVTTSGRLEVNGTLNITGSGGIYTTATSSNTDKIVYGTGTIINNGTLGAGELQGGYSSTLTTLSVSDGLANLAGLEGMNPFSNYTYIGLGPNHNNYWYINLTEVAPSCDADGATRYYCTDETLYYEVKKTGTALGHDWSVTYQWSDDHTTCTASSVCQRDSAHTERETASGNQITSVTTDATFAADGAIVYTAVFASEWAETQTATVVIPKKIAVAQIDNTKYESLKEALDAVQEGDTVVLLADPTAENVVFEKCVTLDISAVPGYEIKCADGWEALDKKDGIWLVHNVSLFDICGSSIKAGDNLDLYFYIYKSDLESPLTDYTARIVRYRQGVADTPIDIPCTDWEDYDDSMVRFCYNDISAKEMTDKIFVTIYKGGEVVSNVRMETVENYALRVLKTLTEASANSKNEKLRTTLVDMLNYGAACQDHFQDYNIDDLANARIDAYQQFATKSVAYENNLTGDGNYFAGSTVSAESSLKYTFYFKDLTGMTAQINYIDHYGTPVAASVTTFRINSNGYGVDVTGLAVADGRQIITCEIKNSDGETVTTASGSVEDYVASAMVNSTADKTVFENLLKFVDSAYAYFHFGEEKT